MIQNVCCEKGSLWFPGVTQDKGLDVDHCKNSTAYARDSPLHSASH